jgi:hypothetical protein
MRVSSSDEYPHLTRDLAIMGKAFDEVTPPVDDIVPEGTVWVSNVRKGPYNGFMHIFQALQERGFGIHFTDTATAMYPAQVPSGRDYAVYVESSDTNTPYDSVVDEVFRNGNPNSTILTSIELGRIGTGGLIEGSESYRDMRQKLSELPDEDFDTALHRMFLSTVLGSIADEARRLDDQDDDETTVAPHYSDDIRSKRNRAYEMVREKGYKPYNSEEILGLAHGAIDDTLGIELEPLPDDPLREFEGPVDFSDFQY